MKERSTDVLIIGAGLTGLTLAYLLRSSGKTVLILEARDRPGGRIHTLLEEGLAPREMGATWLGSKHTALMGLLAELGVGTFKQRMGDRAIYEAISTSPHQLVQLPPNDEPSFRIEGGSSALIDALVNSLEEGVLQYGRVVRSIQATGGALTVASDQLTVNAATVVSTLPPFLLFRTVDTIPLFPPAWQSTLEKTHTWMGESIKVSLAYDRPFWRDESSSGTIFSNVGPVGEMYDHADVEDQHFALKGFLNATYFAISKEGRRDLALAQLRKYYGPVVDEYLTYAETVWRKEPHTFAPYESHVLPHQNNGHPLFRQPLMNGKFFVAGSETADRFPGYMDGAVRSARWVARQLG